MKINQSSVSLLVSILALLMLPSEMAYAEDPAATLAAEAAREYDILAESVARAVGEAIDEGQAEVSTNLVPAINWNVEERKPRNFVNPKGEIESLYTEREYTVEAWIHEYEFEFDQVLSIDRNGKRDVPFSAEIQFEVTRTTRSADMEWSMPIPVPKGFREIQEDNGLIQVPGLEFPAVEFDTKLVFVPDIPVPIDYDEHTARALKNAPDVVKKAAQEAQKACLEATPTVTQGIQKATFRYSLEKKAWVY